MTKYFKGDKLVSEKTKYRIALGESLGSLAVFNVVLFSGELNLPDIFMTIYSDPKLAIPYIGILGYAFADGVMKIVHPAHRSLSERIAGYLKEKE